ncbi:DUF1272 domain-containing protein [Chitinibacter sp. SCUT-21]|uniref:DUF1272 domain-containing protein n=1 Tax=Chitinibacter sp. SCUT-21 TaxID=2970891 RepID=UPI0035A602EE
MLEMKNTCERCGASLGEQDRAYICSFECTFCPHCSEQQLKHTCPNCQGELVLRPRRQPKEPRHAFT